MPELFVSMFHHDFINHQIILFICTSQSSRDIIRQRQDQMEPKKTKKIVKAAKPKEENKQKKPRDVVSKTLGRPKDIDRDDFQMPVDQTEEVKDIILNFLNNIGLFHGLVFRTEDRERLNKDKSSSISWKPEHSWDPEQEQKKAREHIKQINFDELKRKLKLSKPIQVAFFEELYLDVSEIICDEATHQIYEIMTEMIGTMDDKEATQTKTEGLFAKLVMFTGRFTKISVKYYIEIEEQSKIKKLFRPFVRGIQQELRKLITSKFS